MPYTWLYTLFNPLYLTLYTSQFHVDFYTLFNPIYMTLTILMAMTTLRIL